MAIKTFTHAITLNPGETFTLPPNSQILFSTDPTGLESVCTTIPDTELKCYRMHWVVNKDDEGAYVAVGIFGAPVTIAERANAWENTDGSSSTIYFSNAGGMGSVQTTGDIDFTDLAALENFLAGSQFSGALFDRKYKYGVFEGDMANVVQNFTDVPQSGYYTYDFYFKTTDEIADDFYLEVRGDGENIAKKARFLGEEVDCEGYPLTSDVAVCDPLATPPNPNSPQT